MRKKLAFISLLIFTIANSVAQSDTINKNSILIYSVDNGYMQPFIESTLKKLIDTKNNSLYFSSVNSFNRFIVENKYQAELNDLILIHKPYNSKINNYYSDDENLVRKRILNILQEYNYFLTVKTNTLGELIEFQFQLFESTASDSSSSFNISDKVLAVENFFINPKEADYLSQVKNSIQRLFKRSNQVPEAELKIFDIHYYGNGIENNIVLPLNTLINFDGSNSGDYDNENIKYIWRNIPNKNEKYQSINKISFTQDIAKQQVILNEKGNYKIGFKIYDGIDYSNEIILNIQTKEKSTEVVLIDSVTKSIARTSFRPSLLKKKFYGRIYFEDIKYSDSLSNNFILSRKKVSQSFLRNLDNSYFVKSFDLKKDLNNNYSYFEFESFFSEPNIEKEKTYYLYTFDEEGFLNNEKKIIHKLITRSNFNFQARFSSYLIDFIDDEKPGGSTIMFPSITLGIILTNHLELGISVPLLNSKEIIYKNYIFKYPDIYNLSVNYFFDNTELKKFGAFNIFILTELKSYSVSYNDLEKNYISAFSIAPGFGADYKLKSWDSFDLNCRMFINYGFFTDSNFKVNTLTIGYETAFKF